MNFPANLAVSGTAYTERKVSGGRKMIAVSEEFVRVLKRYTVDNIHQLSAAGIGLSMDCKFLFTHFHIIYDDGDDFTHNAAQYESILLQTIWTSVVGFIWSMKIKINALVGIAADDREAILQRFNLEESIATSQIHIDEARELLLFMFEAGLFEKEFTIVYLMNIVDVIYISPVMFIEEFRVSDQFVFVSGFELKKEHMHIAGRYTCETNEAITLLARRALSKVEFRCFRCPITRHYFAEVSESTQQSFKENIADVLKLAIRTNDKVVGLAFSFTLVPHVFKLYYVDRCDFLAKIVEQYLKILDKINSLYKNLLIALRSVLSGSIQITDVWRNPKVYAPTQTVEDACFVGLKMAELGYFSEFGNFDIDLIARICHSMYEDYFP